MTTRYGVAPKAILVIPAKAGIQTALTEHECPFAPATKLYARDNIRKDPIPIFSFRGRPIGDRHDDRRRDND